MRLCSVKFNDDRVPDAFLLTRQWTITAIANDKTNSAKPLE